MVLSVNRGDAATLIVAKQIPAWPFMQCSPYQAVTGKIYRLKQQFLPPATALRLTKIKLAQLIRVTTQCVKNSFFNRLFFKYRVAI